MAFKDMRDWLKAVEHDGELKRIIGADWDLEMSSISEMIYREGKRPVPALLFGEITGYPKGYQALFGLLSSPRRVASALNLSILDEDMGPLDLLRSWQRKEQVLKPVTPALISSGPIQENFYSGEAVDLNKFPSPRCHELDGGRYIGTANVVITKDPDGGWVNLGIYRCMLVDHNRMALHMLEGQHGRLIYDKYAARGEVMPVAVAIGVDPALWFAAGQRLPWGDSEYDYAGGIKDESIEVIEGEYTGLPLPASAEIVIEGECRPGELVDEGPFGEGHGYYANQGLEPVPEPLIDVKTVLHRDDPILTCSSPAVPPGINSLLASMGRAARVWATLEKAGLPGIKGVWAPEEGGSRLLSVISIQQMYAGHSRDVGLIASQCVGNMGRYTVVVDDDIDPCNLSQMIWAIMTRTDPQRSIQILPYCGTSSADPAVPLALKKERKPLYGSRAVIDACQPYERKGEWYPIARASLDLQKRLLKKWTSLFEELC
jgi:4-hydroxy-3-polyprenylbenzoate decarboxylase